MLHLKHVRHRKKKAVIQKKHHKHLDRVVYFVSIAGPMLTVPQIYDIWFKRNLAVNEVTWGGYVLCAAIWMYYGIVHNDKPIIISNCLWIVAQGLVVVGALHFK